MEQNVNSELEHLALEKIKFGEILWNSLNDFSEIEGIQKLQRKIKQELNFLKKIIKSNTIKKEHLQCSNLTHFAALLNTLQESEKCISVGKVFNLDDRKITIDIICEGGLSWVKVVARNPKSINQICIGDSSYGVRSILDQAIDFIECAQFHPCLFQTPKVVFVFANGIGLQLAAKLESLGVVVQGERLKHLYGNEELGELNSSDEEKTDDVSSTTELSTKNISHIMKVNLDVSAMLAYVSSVTNGSCNLYEFSVPVLAQQARWECHRPQKPILDEFFKDKTLYCCQTAATNFINIVNTVGGPNEKIRADEFLKRIIVLPDNATACDTAEGNSKNKIFDSVQLNPEKELHVGGKVKERSLIIFKFGDRIQAVTVTANDGFVRAAKQQGINFVVFIHESRALTEQKEMTQANLIS